MKRISCTKVLALWTEAVFAVAREVREMKADSWRKNMFQVVLGSVYLP